MMDRSERDLTPSRARELQLIRILADGFFHSGEELGVALEVSRAAVWKRLQGLADLGLDIERVRGKGYRLGSGLILLDPGRVLNAGGIREGELDLRVASFTGSTNSDALAEARVGLGRPLAVLAECQSAGRGRRGRSWVSPFGSSLFLSFAVEFPGGAAQLEGLSLATGVVVAETLENCLRLRGIGLKWPNDILLEGRKLGGILIELTGDLDASCTAVIGIGINCAIPRPAGARIDQPWTDLLEATGSVPDRNLLAGKLLAALLEMAAGYVGKGFAWFAPRWHRYDLLKDQDVELWLADERLDGVARGVSDRGALLIEREGRIAEYHGGEITLRKATRRSVV